MTAHESLAAFMHDLARQVSGGLCQALGTLPYDNSPVACGLKPGHHGPHAWADMRAVPYQRQATLFDVEVAL